MIKRRTNVVGIFPNDAPIVRLVGSQLLEQQEEWQMERRRYFSEATMSKIQEPEEALELTDADPPTSRQQVPAKAHQLHPRSTQNTSIAELPIQRSGCIVDEWRCPISFQAIILLLLLFTLQKGAQGLLSYTTWRGATNSREDNKEIKENRMPEGWDENLDRLQQRDLNAQWVNKYDINHHGYKNNICFDVEHGFIRRHAVTPANIHDSQMLPMLTDPEKADEYVWTDSAYAGECFENLLNLGVFENCIHEKGSRNHPLSEVTKERNQIKSAIGACVEHVFGYMTMSTRGKMTRKIGLERNNTWWSIKNLTFNFM